MPEPIVPGDVSVPKEPVEFAGPSARVVLSRPLGPATFPERIAPCSERGFEGVDVPHFPLCVLSVTAAQLARLPGRVEYEW